jgi:carboxyl-terminal processing protease
LQQKILYIKNNRHQGPGHYVKYSTALQADFINEKEYDSLEMVYPNEAFRLHFLCRYWNTINYFFPYKNVIGKDWSDLLHEFVPLFAEAADSLQYQIAVATLIHSINDSHTMSANPVLQNEYGKLFIPVRTKIINDEAVVTGYYNDSLGKLTGLEPGDVIEKVGDKTVKELIIARAPLVCGSNDPRKWMNLLLSYNYIFGGKETTTGLTVRNKKGRTAIIVNRYPRELFNYQPPSVSVSKILPGNIGYINLGGLKVAEVEDTFLKLKDCRAIIFDVRNHCRDIFTYITYNLLESQQPFAKLLFPNLDYPGTYLWKEASKTGPIKPNKNIYKGKVVLLVNENCISHDEWTTMALQSVPGSVTIGSQTAGADGNIFLLLLPGKISTFVTGLGVFYPDGTPTQRVGIKIDIEVHPTQEGIREGRDEVLDRAIKYIQDGR